MPRVKGTFVSGGETARGQRWDAFKKCHKIGLTLKLEGPSLTSLRKVACCSRERS